MFLPFCLDLIPIQRLSNFCRTIRQILEKSMLSTEVSSSPEVPYKAFMPKLVAYSAKWMSTIFSPWLFLTFTNVQVLHIRCKKKATAAVQQKHKTVALSHLRLRKELEDLLSKRLGSLDNLESTLLRVKASAGDIEVYYPFPILPK